MTRIPIQYKGSAVTTIVTNTIEANFNKYPFDDATVAHETGKHYKKLDTILGHYTAKDTVELRMVDEPQTPDLSTENIPGPNSSGPSGPSPEASPSASETTPLGGNTPTPDNLKQ